MIHQIYILYLPHDSGKWLGNDISQIFIHELNYAIMQEGRKSFKLSLGVAPQPGLLFTPLKTASIKLKAYSMVYLFL